MQKIERLYAKNKPALISMHGHYAGRKRVEQNLESANLHDSIYYEWLWPFFVMNDPLI